MTNRACVFVDGENFRHAIVELFRKFSKSDYLPKTADWGGLFDWIVGEVDNAADRVRTYWYVIQWLDFFPYKFPNARSDPQKLRKVLNKHPPIKQSLDPLSNQPLVSAMEREVERLRKHQMRMLRRAEGWTTIQDDIAARHAAIEFRRAGSIKYNLFDGTLGNEKSVDVKLATDMIVLRDIYDIAIIVSGDQDYVPAVQAIKDCGKKVVNIAFETTNGRLLPGGARRLNQITDKSLRVRHRDLAGHLRISLA